jgi:hypothetical protein
MPIGWQSHIFQNTAGTFVKTRFAGLARRLHSWARTELFAHCQEMDSASRRREWAVAGDRGPVTFPYLSPSSPRSGFHGPLKLSPGARRCLAPERRGHLRRCRAGEVFRALAAFPGRRRARRFSLAEKEQRHVSAKRTKCFWVFVFT